MKKLLFTATAGLLCFLISCKNADNSGASSMDNTKNKEHVRGVYDAIESGDVSKLDSFIAKDAVDHTERGEVRGLDSIKAMLGDLHNHIKDLKMEIVTDASNGDYGFTLHKMTGTCTDASMGMPANTKMDMTGVDVVKYKDGKAIEHWAFADAGEMMKMMNMGHEGMGKMEDKMSGKMDSSKKK